jgi:hypothetical protein
MPYRSLTPQEGSQAFLLFTHPVQPRSLLELAEQFATSTAEVAAAIWLLMQATRPLRSNEISARLRRELKNEVETDGPPGRRQRGAEHVGTSGR